MMRKQFLAASAIALLIAGAGCKKAFEKEDYSYDPDAGKETIDKVENSDENLDKVIASSIDEQASDYEFNTLTANKIIGKGSTVAVEGTGSVADGAIATINKSGCYIIEGTLSDGRVVVDLDKDDKGLVQLILSGCDITSNGGAALKIKTCPKVSILLKEGSISSLKSMATTDTSATIQSSQSIYLSSSAEKPGSLNVSSVKNQAIKTSDGIIIKSGKYSISSTENDGIQAKDFIKIDGGEIDIEAYQHALKTTSTKENKGFIYISDGELNLTSTAATSDDGGKDAIHAEGTINILNGKLKLSSADDGISAGAHIIIDNGTIDITKADKCIASLGNITINGGNITLSPTATKTSSESGSGHGITSKKTDNGTRIGNVNINGGNISITKSYEGIQGVKITFNGGHTIINSLDDAVNASDGSSQTPGGFGQRPGMGGNSASSSCGLYINDGFLMVTSTGDGIDSNGELIIKGGIVLVSQNGQANEPIDAGDGYEPTISGGVVIAVGSQGMASAPKCTQTAFFTSGSGQAGKYLAVNDADGKNILAWKVPQAYQIITVSAPELGTGTYTYTTNATVSGKEYVSGTGFYYPAESATGSGSSISLTTGSCTGTAQGGMGGPGGFRPGW